MNHKNAIVIDKKKKKTTAEKKESFSADTISRTRSIIRQIL